ncbi:MAG: hypothetical protein O2890_00580 [Cyanobacteria bacterium]|nr:hypothetical protein [Cyanobacteriota bacterium]MDA0864926.1 hypothetical protein [Cyanobacteriota bacterium]
MGLVKFVRSRVDARDWCQRARTLILVMLIAIGLGSCHRPEIKTSLLLNVADGPHQALSLRGKLSEVSPPDTLQSLKPFLEVYEPQVQIVFPREGVTVAEPTVAVQVQVRDLPIYKDPDLGLGPHFHLALDDQPGRDIYEADTTVSFDNLAPGTHTLRAFAARPWHESFKNEGAFDQVTFNVFTTSPKNNAGQNTPLLTYSQPQGIYGAEPILLDFYLTNVPLHVIATKDEAISDWRIRCTVNGESFVFDRWQPLYLKGFNPGQNWVKLELIDETGQLFPGPFNSAIGVVEYRPGEADPLTQLIRGDIPVDIARVLVDPSYQPPVPDMPEEDAIPELTIDAQGDQMNAPDLSEVRATPLEPEAGLEQGNTGAADKGQDTLFTPAMVAPSEPGQELNIEPGQGLAEPGLPSMDPDSEVNAADFLDTDRQDKDAITEDTAPGLEGVEASPKVPGDPSELANDGAEAADPGWSSVDAQIAHELNDVQAPSAGDPLAGEATSAATLAPEQEDTVQGADSEGEIASDTEMSLD